MKKLVILFLLVGMIPVYVFAQTKKIKLESTNSFFSKNEKTDGSNVEFKYLTVSENWNENNGKEIKIAVTILKSKANNAKTILYLEGGPGAGGIASIDTWLNNPLRNTYNIVLVDARGTGNSLPKLCPDLGNKFLEILAKNQSSMADEQQKVTEAINCKESLIQRGIDISQYNSTSIARDLNALKTALHLKSWNVYGTSYGTYVAQVYANNYPQDIQSLILDSSISDIAQYYDQNTANYMTSLDKVFDACKNDPNCNQQYPDLEKVFYSTIEKLSKNPITVNVDKKMIPSGKFTYNAEDFKISIQQALYSKKLIQVLPLLITEFNHGNKKALSSLVTAFSGALGLDYGMYYCVSCNEALNFNSLDEFDKKSLNYKNLKGGLSFYRSDFKVCEKWNLGMTPNKSENDLSKLYASNIPVLIFSGEFDPITPAKNGLTLSEKFKNSSFLTIPAAGHVPGFTMSAMKIINDFMANPNQKPNFKDVLSDTKVHFVTGVKSSTAISNMSNSLNDFNLLFFTPFLIAITILLIAVFNFGFSFFKNKKEVVNAKLLKVLIVVTSILGIFIFIAFLFAINSTAQQNYYILAFGIPDKFNYLFTALWIFIGLTAISLLYFVTNFKNISNGSTTITILFSILLVGVYFNYWGFLF
ncbi:alpha/beta fold hydrolase [Flavobacterium aquidurense]|uniref:Peptidase family S33 alpha/beta hydrolase or acyltransferase n=1 Tax=Flavobacterium aquidurense TaxID=362413 RepID=A0A0Q0SBD6_9FLAO|nr:alpha/beta fold hydrolase [Flavobacterium aquidurense]KQB41351.1 Peptidase family S33 alpha/beta hydrolase or acyltransferase [Flavobacterium aquidurense]